MSDSNKEFTPLEEWKRFVEANNKEKQWMHERLSWLLGIQPVLFAALAASTYYQHDCGSSASQYCTHQNDVLRIIFYASLMLGVLLSSAVSIGLVAAGRMHWVWTTHLNRLGRTLNDQAAKRSSGEAFPTVPFGTHPLWPARTSSLLAPTLGIVFTLIWITLLFYFGGLSAGLGGLISSAVIYALVAYFVVRYHRDPQAAPRRDEEASAKAVP